MAEQGKVESGDGDNAPGPYVTRRQARQQRLAARRGDRYAGGLGWMAGALLLAIGVLYMLQVLGLLPPFSNWWAMFLLLPALGCFSAAIGAYRRHENWAGQALGLVIAGLLFVGLAAVFFFDLDIRWFGPLFLIVAGILLLVGVRVR